MKKSVYSLVLADDVIEAVDRMACRENTSRSNMINQILAERLGFVTPEMRMRDIFSQIEALLDEGNYQFQSQSSDSLFSIRSSLSYKYRPTVRYMIELYREPRDIVGELKVSFRTNSRNFADLVEDFFTRWMRIEEDYLAKVHTQGVPAQLDNGRYTRGFLEITDGEHLTAEEIAEAISGYIQVLDGCLNYYFQNLSDEELTDRGLRRRYQGYLTSGVRVV